MGTTRGPGDMAAVLITGRPGKWKKGKAPRTRRGATVGRRRSCDSWGGWPRRRAEKGGLLGVWPPRGGEGGGRPPPPPEIGGAKPATPPPPRNPRPAPPPATLLTAPANC